MPVAQVLIEQDNNSWVVGATNVKFKKSAPGGDVSASFRIIWGHLVDTLRSEARVYISDRSSGRILWYGIVSNPGEQSQARDGYLDVSCDGSLVFLDEEKKIRPYVISRFSAWALSDSAATYPPEAKLEVGQMTEKTNDGKPTEVVYEGLTLMVPKGAPVKPWFGPNASHYKNAAVHARSYAFDNTGYWIGSVVLRYRNYGDSNNWVTRAYLDNSLGTIIFSDASAENEPAFASWYRGRDSSSQATPTAVQLSFYTAAHNGKDGKYAPFWHDGSSAGRALNYDLSPPEPNLNGDYLGAPFSMYASFDLAVLVTHIWDRKGQPVTNMPLRYWLLPHEVIEDILGRDLLNRFSNDTSYSEVTTSASVRLLTFDYTDQPVSTRKVLDDLVELEGNRYFYMTLPPRNAGEKPGLTWKVWHSAPRYVTFPDAELDLTGAQKQLVNRVSIRWKDAFGRVFTNRFTAHPDQFPDTLDLGEFYPDLWESNPGDLPGISSVNSLYNPSLGWDRIVESDPIDLGEEGSAGDALQMMASRVLQAQARRERSGTVKVTRVMDLWDSTVKRACMIEPGYSLYISSTQESIRITDVEYDDQAGTSSLSVANPGLVVGQLLTDRTYRKA